MNNFSKEIRSRIFAFQYVCILSMGTYIVYCKVHRVIRGKRGKLNLYSTQSTCDVPTAM